MCLGLVGVLRCQALEAGMQPLGHGRPIQAAWPEAALCSLPLARPPPHLHNEAGYNLQHMEELGVSIL